MLILGKNTLTTFLLFRLPSKFRWTDKKSHISLSVLRISPKLLPPHPSSILAFRVWFYLWLQMVGRRFGGSRFGGGRIARAAPPSSPTGKGPPPAKHHLSRIASTLAFYKGYRIRDTRHNSHSFAHDSRDAKLLRIKFIFTKLSLTWLPTFL